MSQPKSYVASICATYQPQGDQIWRCSPNFPSWNTTELTKLKLTILVPEGYPQPQISIAEDRRGSDPKWYENLFDGSIFDVTNPPAEPIKTSKLYVGTVSDLPDGLDGGMQYVVIISAVE